MLLCVCFHLIDDARDSLAHRAGVMSFSGGLRFDIFRLFTSVLKALVIILRSIDS